jgi:HD-GYP domain-containing protein (c-di-GMP phosphodiesterase class II)
VSLLYDELDNSVKERISKPKLLDAALLHDIGKISIEDDILKRTGALSEQEFEEMKKHPLNGKKTLGNTCYDEIGDWALFHHERVDGNGYYNLAPEDIPFESKLIAVADTYSASCMDRVYRAKKRTQTPYKLCLKLLKPSVIHMS